MRPATREAKCAPPAAPAAARGTPRVGRRVLGRGTAKSRPPAALWPAILLAAAWTMAQILAGCGVLPDELRTYLVFWKNAFGIVFFIAALVACPSALRPSPLALASAAFPLYAAFRLWARNGFDDPLIVLYAAWWLGFFVVVPTAFRQRLAYRRLIAWIAGAGLFAVGVGVILGVANDQVYWWDHQRVVFSFTNPIYLGYGGLIVALGAFFLLRLRRRSNMIHYLIMTFGVAIVIGARARNGLLFIAAFGLTYVVIGRRQKLVVRTLVALF